MAVTPTVPAQIATGVEVGSFVAPDGAGHPAAVTKQLTLIQQDSFSGFPYVASDITVTSSTVLVDTTLVSPNLVAGGVYAIEAYLSFTSDGAGGVTLVPDGGLTGAATATLFRMDSLAYTASALSAHGTVTALNSNLFSAAAAISLILLEGTLIVNAAGYFGLQFAQQTSDATATVLKAGSWMNLTRIA